MSDDDPRLRDEFVRRVPGDGASGSVLVVGVVHDHPASVHRVREAVRAEAPDVLALELAPLALPLFEQYAARDDPASARGGEMSAAIDASDADRVEAVDGPSLGFLRRLVARLWQERPTRSTVRDVCARFASVSRHVLACRLAAAVGRVRSETPHVHDQTVHDVDASDAPETQAADERKQVRRATSVLSALSSPTHATFRESTREAHMAARLDALREDGDVVAVVGYGHLDAVTERLTSGEF